MDTTNVQHSGAATSPSSHQGPGLLLGALVGLLLIVPLTAIMVVVTALLGTDFVPFNMFDWFVRIEPLGGFISFGKELMAGTLRLLPFGELSSNAKTVEQLMGVVGMIVTGIVVSAIFFAFMRSRGESSRSNLPGIILGLIVGVPVMLISLSVSFSSTTSPLVNEVSDSGRLRRLGCGDADGLRSPDSTSAS